MKIEADGSGKIQSALLRIQASVNPDVKVMDEIGDDIATRIRMSIGAGTTPWGDRFRPLQDIAKDQRFRGGKREKKGGGRTAKYERHMSGPHEPLNDTGIHIRERITHRPEPGAVSVGLLDSENAKIGRVHQWGATIVPKVARFLAIPYAGGVIFAKKAVIPPRPFLPIRPGGNVDLPQSWLDGVIGRLIEKIESTFGS